MKRIALLLAGVVCLAAPARAAGTFDLSWDGCTGPIVKTITPGSVNTVYATLSGQSEGMLGYTIRLAISTNCPCLTSCNQPTQPPDAWRFDAGGCQGSISDSLVFIDRNPEVALSKTCPAFAPNYLPTYQVTEVEYEFFPRLVLGVAYGSEGVASADPNLRYTLGRFVIDQSFGVTGAGTPGTCGGLESPICIWRLEGTWFPIAGNAPLAWNAGVSYLRTSDPSPARATTWGAIKNQYR